MTEGAGGGGGHCRGLWFTWAWQCHHDLYYFKISQIVNFTWNLYLWSPWRPMTALTPAYCLSDPAGWRRYPPPPEGHWPSDHMHWPPGSFSTSPSLGTRGWQYMYLTKWQMWPFKSQKWHVIICSSLLVSLLIQRYDPHNISNKHVKRETVIFISSLYSHNIGLMLGQRRRRWTTIKPILGYCQHFVCLTTHWN